MQQAARQSPGSSTVGGVRCMQSLAGRAAGGWCACILPMLPHTLNTASGSDLSTALICLDHTKTPFSRMWMLALSLKVWSGCCVSAAGSGSSVWPLVSPMLTLTARPAHTTTSSSSSRAQTTAGFGCSQLDMHQPNQRCTCGHQPVHAVRHLLRHDIRPALLVDTGCQERQEDVLCQR